MMRDAGIDWDSIMLYEADSKQFNGFIKQWSNYTTRKQINLLVGDVVDWPLHQKTLNPAGPEDFIQRNLKAVEGFHKDGPVRGLFVHDYNRARRGRLGPYSTQEWLLAGGASLTSLRALHHRLPYVVSISAPQTIVPGSETTVTVNVENLSKPIQRSGYCKYVSTQRFKSCDHGL